MAQFYMSGRRGEVRWSYRHAATLGEWSLSAQDSPLCTLTAVLVNHDAFAVTQRPLMFSVPREKGPAWCWPIISLQINGSTLTASVSLEE